MKLTKSIIFCFLSVLFSVYGHAQDISIKGKVIDENGMPVPGAGVLIKGTTKATSSDMDGNYQIKAASDGTLVYSFVGYGTIQEAIKGRTTIDVKLNPESQSLKEVVVVGYGTQKKKEVTGAVSVLDSKAIERLNPTRVEQALQGQIAGVNVTSSSGSPGSDSNIRIRGVTTNGNNKPLILVDGNRIEDLSVLNPNDIKSINVLKDATAGIYGVQGANGVILITTKTGRKNSELKFQFDSFTGVQATSKKIDLLNAKDFAIYVNDAADKTKFFVYPREGTDWQDEVFNNAIISSLNFSASGGTKKSAYTFGISHLDQDGIVGLGKSNYTRTTGRLGYQYDILDNLKLSSTFLYTNSKKNNLPEGGIGSVLYSAVNINPNLPVRDLNGDYSLANEITQIEIINPLAQIANNYNTTKVDKYSGTIGLDYTFFKHFTASSKFQINYSNVLEDVFRPIANYGNSKSPNRAVNEVQDFSAEYTDYTWDNYINYNNTFGKDHDITALLGTSIYQTTGTFFGKTGLNLKNGSNSVSDAFANNDVSNRVDGLVTPRFNEAQLGLGLDHFDSRLYSIFTRLQYSYKGRYLLSAVLRRDVSSSFSPENNNNVGYFPSGSLGWNVSDEDFLKDSKWINSLKFRASYGIIGNDRINKNFAYVTLLTGEATIAPGNEAVLGDLLNGSAVGVIGNKNLKWEEQETANIGFDASFFENKISITADVFKKQTRNLLIAPQASGLIGASAPGTSVPFINAGNVENKGVEFKIGYDDKFSDNFKFNVSFNVTALNNEVVSLNGNTAPAGGEFGVGISQTGISRMEIGQPLGYFHGYKTNGIYQTQAEIDALNSTATGNNGVYHAGAKAGDLRFVDTNGNGYIDDADRTNIGDPIPNVTMGFNIGFSYKNIDFSANAFASVGNDMVRDYERKDLFANKGTYMLDRWQGTGTSNTVPRAVSGASINTDLFSDFYVEDASFVRLQNVQLGYTFSQKVLNNTGIDKIRVYLSGNNLFTITDYKGYDPSAGIDAPIGNGIDKGFYPVASSYLLGINLNF